MKKPSPQAIDLISTMSLQGYTPRQIKELMFDASYLRLKGISNALSSEIYTFMDENWEAVCFYCRSSR